MSKQQQIRSSLPENDTQTSDQVYAKVAQDVVAKVIKNIYSNVTGKYKKF